MPKNAKDIPALTPAALAEHLSAVKAVFSQPQREALFIYLEELVKWNRVMNLVGPYSWKKMVDELILDSLDLEIFIRLLKLPEKPRVWDFGAGAGLPGIPLRILWQAGEYTMVDSREKRVLFLQTVLSRLNLPGTSAVQARVEDFMQNAEPADLLISRAFMPWQKLLELVKGKIRPGGEVLFMALEPPPADLPDGWEYKGQRCYYVPAGRRYLWAALSL